MDLIEFIEILFISIGISFYFITFSIYAIIVSTNIYFEYSKVFLNMIFGAFFFMIEGIMEGNLISVVSQFAIIIINAFFYKKTKKKEKLI